MTVVLTLLLLGVLDNTVPTDAEIAARIEAALRLHLSPRAAQVTVHRSSRFATTLDALDITLRGFTVEELPFEVAAPAAVPASARPAPGVAEMAPARPAKPGKHIRIVKLRLRCEEFILRGLPVQALDMTLDEVRVPMAAVNEGRLAIAAAASAAGAVILHERALTQFIAARPLPITNPTVAVTPDGLRVTGGLKAFLNAPVEVRGALAARQ
ncbi:MAG TPA: hypothetical protein PK794_07335, partial [Armatimonadota bacterium]|nr:hypothetical protein [Armatimonadota bacterium]